ncbi:hypothetical protein LINPERHAP2_LOCUS16407 [Linum perenne]
MEPLSVDPSVISTGMPAKVVKRARTGVDGSLETAMDEAPQSPTPAATCFWDKVAAIRSKVLRAMRWCILMNLM